MGSSDLKNIDISFMILFARYVCILLYQPLILFDRVEIDFLLFLSYYHEK